MAREGRSGMADQLAGDRCQVLVVGAGPAGAATAYHLAKAGIDVLVLEKSVFPRDKICGDGLTPGAVKEILAMGINPLAEGWQPNYGLSVIGGGHRITLPWPKNGSLPAYGLTRQRTQLDHRLIKQAVSAGARLVENTVVQDLLTDGDGYARGVSAIKRDPKTRNKQEVSFSAQYVVDCSGANARLASRQGRSPLKDRPLAVAARAYFRSPRGNETMMESHLELWDGKPGKSNLLPGYGWLFPMGDGLVNVGLGSVSSGAQSTKLPYKQIFQRWVANLPDEWGLTEENMVGSLRSAPLPMAFNRKPAYENGLLLVGDAAGMVSPFNGEGIAPGMFAGRRAADALIQALGRTTRAQAELALREYPRDLQDQYGGYYSLGRVFVRLIENPKIMHACTKYGLDKPALMRFVHKMLSDGYERRGGVASDKMLRILTKVVIPS